MSPHLPPSLLHLLRPSSPPDCTSLNEKSNGDRHFVSWTEEEDEILRQAVRLYGTEKWSAISAQFRNKTSRQCRRRWSTYLITNCRKGGWSPEEDQLLLEAHRKFGNRWTEIAKVVSGRTDNAVKNRFSALSKKQAKDDVSSSQSSGDLGTDDSAANQKRKVLSENINILNKKNGSERSKLPQFQEAGQQCIPENDAAHLHTRDERFAYRAHPLKREPLLQSGTLGKKISYGFHQDAENIKVVSTAGLSAVHENVPKNPVSNQGANLSDLFVMRQDAKSEDLDRCKKVPKAWFSTIGGGMDFQTNIMASGSLSLVTSLEYAYGDMEEPLNLFSSKCGCSTDAQGKQSTCTDLEKIVLEYEGTINVSLEIKCTEESPLPSPSITSVPPPTTFVPHFQFLADGMPSPQFSDSERQFLLSALDVDTPCTSFPC